MKIEANADFVSVGQLVQQSIVVAFAAADPVALRIESHAWDECHVDVFDLSEGLSRGFLYAERARLESVVGAIEAQFERVVADDHGQKYALAHGGEAGDSFVGVNLVGQGMVEEHRGGRCNPRMGKETVDNGLRLCA